MKLLIPPLCRGAVILLLAATAHAETINWYCISNKTNLTGNGANMGASFSFQLGVFSKGFVPTASNLNEWSTYWTSAGSAAYSTVYKSFTGIFVVTSNAAPFTVGAKAYVWGRSTSATGDQWMLFRDTSWTWPAPNLIGPPMDGWDASTANEIILGAIQPTGTPYLRSEAVTSYAQWQTANLSGNPLNLPGNDPDHDGMPNSLEFVFGTNPVVAGNGNLTSSFVSVSGQSYLLLTAPRLRNRLATCSFEASSDLQSWTPATTETANTATILSVRDNTAIAPGMPRRFMRFKTVVQP